MSEKTIEFNVIEGNPVLAMLGMMLEGSEFEVMDMGEDDSECLQDKKQNQ